MSNRTPYYNRFDAELLKQLKQLSGDIRIPVARLLDESIADLLLKYESHLKTIIKEPKEVKWSKALSEDYHISQEELRQSDSFILFHDLFQTLYGCEKQTNFYSTPKLKRAFNTFCNSLGKTEANKLILGYFKTSLRVYGNKNFRHSLRGFLNDYQYLKKGVDSNS